MDSYRFVISRTIPTDLTVDGIDMRTNSQEIVELRVGDVFYLPDLDHIWHTVTDINLYSEIIWHTPYYGDGRISFNMSLREFSDLYSISGTINRDRVNVHYNDRNDVIHEFVAPYIVNVANEEHYWPQEETERPIFPEGRLNFIGGDVHAGTTNTQQLESYVQAADRVLRDNTNNYREIFSTSPINDALYNNYTVEATTADANDGAGLVGAFLGMPVNKFGERRPQLDEEENIELSEEVWVF